MEDLQKQVNAVGTPRIWEEQLIEYYRNTYGDRRWTRRLAEKIHSVIQEIKTDIKSIRIRNMQIKSIMRRFQGKPRTGPINSDWQKVYSTLGRKPYIPRLPPPGGYIVTGTVHMLFSNDQCKSRDIGTLHITGQDAEEFAKKAEVQMIIDLHNKVHTGGPKLLPCKEEENKLEVRAYRPDHNN